MMMRRILIKNGRVWDGEAFGERDVLLCGDCVERMAPGISAPADEVFDARGMIVSPGLVDLHTHLKGVALEKFAVEAERVCFPFGVTVANNAGSVAGGSAYLAAPPVKITAFTEVNIRENRLRLRETQALLEEYGAHALGLKVYFDTTVSPVWDLTPLIETCAYARQRGLKVMVHCSHSPVPMADIIRTLSPGDILTHSFHGDEHPCPERAFEAMKLAKEKGVVIDTGFAGHVHTDFSVFRQAIQNGFLPDTISTDITKFSACKRGGYYGMTMCMSLAKVCGMHENDIFRAVTSAPARALGLGPGWGVLKEGSRSDTAVFSEDGPGFSLTDAAGNHVEGNRTYRCWLTVANGRIVYRDE